MSLGLILLMALAALILFGVGQRVLDRLYLTDRQALFWVAAIFVGGFVPDLAFGLVRVNIGGALIPFALCVYVLVRTDTTKERVRALVAAALTGASVYLIGRLMPADPVQMPLDPNYLYAMAGGVIAYVLGRSRRASFVAAVLGVLGADIAVGAMNFAAGLDQALLLGSAGAADVVVLAGFFSVLLCELVGELLERLTRGTAQPMATGRRKR